MRTQPVTRRVDAVGSPLPRYVLWLGCGHKITLTLREVAAMTHADQVSVQASPTWPCHFCPDPTPEVVREAKSAHQLWKEAGEP
jgi:hypothetical protein